MTAISHFRCTDVAGLRRRTPGHHLGDRLGRQQVGIRTAQDEHRTVDPVTELPKNDVEPYRHGEELTDGRIKVQAEAAALMRYATVAGEVTPLRVTQTPEGCVNQTQMRLEVIKGLEVPCAGEITPNPPQRRSGNASAEIAVSYTHL